MATAAPAGAVRLGSTMYLFKSASNSTDCMISAHGGYVRESRAFRVPANTTIRFFASHGAVLNDPGVTTLAKDMSKSRARETFTAGMSCPNYLLSKYQGAHSGADGKSVNETYEQVSAAVGGRDRIRAVKFEKLMASDSKTQIAKLNDLMSDWGGSILTVRNRWNVLVGVTLEQAVIAAQKESKSIRIFHCSFCRSSMFDANPSSESVVFEY